MKYLGILLFLCFPIKNQAQRSDFSHISFKSADSIAAVNKGADLNNLPKLAFDLTHNLNTDVERFRAIYIWVCSNVKNDFRMYQRNHAKRVKYRDDSIKLRLWNKRFQKVLFKQLHKNQKTICSGYAFLIKELCDLSGLESEIIDGYARTSTTNIEKLTTPNHQWNAIKLNNKWYLNDATWASGITNPNTFKFEFNYNDGFFLSPPELFAINHYPTTPKWFVFKQNTPSFETFLNGPVLYGNAYKYLRKHQTPVSLENQIQKKETIVFTYELNNPEEITNIQFEIDNGNSISIIKPNKVSINGSSLVIEHQFTSNGYYDLHLFLNEDRIATYVFNVKG